MGWRKLLETDELIAYEKHSKKAKIRIEARNRNDAWLVYKTYNFSEGEEVVSHVKEYIARSINETKSLIVELQNENDVTLTRIKNSQVQIDFKRIFKEEFTEKWRIKINGDCEENLLMLRYGTELTVDIIMHDKYNDLEKQVLEAIIEQLGLKSINSKIRYDFFYYRKHSAKRRIYCSKEKRNILAKVEFSIDPNL